MAETLDIADVQLVQSRKPWTDVDRMLLPSLVPNADHIYAGIGWSAEGDVSRSGFDSVPILTFAAETSNVATLHALREVFVENVGRPFHFPAPRRPVGTAHGSYNNKVILSEPVCTALWPLYIGDIVSASGRYFVGMGVRYTDPTDRNGMAYDPLVNPGAVSVLHVGCSPDSNQFFSTIRLKPTLGNEFRQIGFGSFALPATSDPYVDLRMNTWLTNTGAGMDYGAVQDDFVIGIRLDTAAAFAGVMPYFGTDPGRSDGDGVLQLPASSPIAAHIDAAWLRGYRNFETADAQLKVSVLGTSGAVSTSDRRREQRSAQRTYAGELVISNDSDVILAQHLIYNDELYQIAEATKRVGRKWVVSLSSGRFGDAFRV